MDDIEHFTAFTSGTQQHFSDEREHHLDYARLFKSTSVNLKNKKAKNLISIRFTRNTTVVH